MTKNKMTIMEKLSELIDSVVEREDISDLAPVVELSEQSRTFLEAARAGDMKRLRKLLPSVDVNVADPRSGKTALHYAAIRCDYAMVEFLLEPRSAEQCADVFCRDARERTAYDYVFDVIRDFAALPIPDNERENMVAVRDLIREVEGQRNRDRNPALPRPHGPRVG